jgi:simple sugar transport system permease protein
MGINVTRVRYLCVASCGAFSGMAGAFLSLSYLSMFIEGMTAGRGFIALAAVIVAGWDPVKALIICLLFGFADSLQLRLQIMGTGIPYSFLMMIPYLMTISILVAKGRVFVPKALGVPYRKVEE